MELDLKRAIDIVDPKTHDTAMVPYSTGDCHLGAVIMEEACSMVAAYARRMLAVEKDEPLTLEELWEMDRQPVWIKWMNGCGDDMWALICVAFQALILSNTHFYPLSEANYGRTYLAYRRPPEEATP